MPKKPTLSNKAKAHKTHINVSKPKKPTTKPCVYCGSMHKKNIITCEGAY